MSWFRRAPIRTKLMLVILTSCALALALALAVLARVQHDAFRRTLARNTTILADIIAESSRAALAFDDPVDAAAKLQTLRSEPHVTAAKLYGAGGEEFADYRRSADDEACPPRPAELASRFDARQLTVFRSVRLSGRQIGSICVQSDLEGIRQQMRLFAGVGALVLLGSLAAAMILSSRLQRGISGPVLALASTARVVAQRQDFSLRAVREAGDEVGDLTDAFNAMLARIEQREEDLTGAIQALQVENEERTNAEREVQLQVERLELLNRITRAIGERQDLRSIFQVLVNQLQADLPAELACVGLLDEADGTLRIAGVALSPDTLVARPKLAEESILPLDPTLNSGLEGSMIYIPDTGATPHEFARGLHAAGLCSMVAAPLLVESRAFGLLIVARRGADAFQPGERQFLRQVSEHAGLASHQAQLHSALQQAYDELRQTQQAVMQQESLRALGQMASGIAHDINNAISPIALYTELLLESESSLSPAGRESLETIQRAIDDVAQTVARMREFYRDRETEVSFEAMDLNRLVRQVVDLTRARWSDMPQKLGIVIRVKTELAPDLPRVGGSESEVREALTNLVFNAVDAMPEGGDLVLRTRIAVPSPANSELSPMLAQVEVSDSGVGMDEETLRRCVEPFYTTKGERGTGLGLAMVYGIAKRHSAEVDIESQEGGGTTVRLSFLPFQGGDSQAEIPAQGYHGRRGLQILAIDDDPLVLRALREALLIDGHEVTTASDGREGIEVFRAALATERSFDVVATDLGMPYVDGRRVAMFVKSESPSTLVLMLTGWGRRLLVDDEIPAHVDHLLPKPPKLRQLRDILSHHFPVQGA